MVATAIIIFREILEAALIIGIVAAATFEVPKRNRWIAGGVLAGVVGAFMIAGFAGVIVEFADGMGQEIFNASVLFAAVAMLAWHNIWMAKHSRDLVSQMKQTGSAVKEGAEPMYALTLVVGLAVLREGSEIVLFLHGLAASGASINAMALGSGMGLVVGALVGMALYFGLSHIPTKHIFDVTSWMIVLLAAGLASQGAMLLVQADMLPAWGYGIWDVSYILRNESPLGNLLRTLVGYDASPAGMQMAVYVGTILFMGIAMKIMNQTRKKTEIKSAAATVLVLPVLLLSMVDKVQAGPATKVYTPTVEYGETEIELLGGYYSDKNDDVDGQSAAKIGLGHGVTTWWFSELEFKWDKEAKGSTDYTAAEWVNIFQLTEQGQYFVDLGLFAEVVFPDENNKAEKLEIGPMFQKEIGLTVNNFNPIWVRDFGSHAEHNTEFEYTWQSRVIGNRMLEFGAQGMGEIEDWSNMNSFNDQEHKLGPAIFGEFKVGANKIKYDSAVLVGATSNTPDYTWRFQVEYEI